MARARHSRSFAECAFGLIEEVVMSSSRLDVEVHAERASETVTAAAAA
ncbi:hypothetical protein [Aquamicrobium zhengzhouense]|nr:hypothetical protein [Aquamicrobium zhengzhouense]